VDTFNQTGLHRIAAWKMKGQRIVFANGCFDLLHPGHIKLLEEAWELGDRLVVALNSDNSVRRLKGNERPILPLSWRIAQISALRCVDAVLAFEENTPLELIQIVQPDVIVKGGDYKPEEVVGAKEIKEWGGEVVILPLLPGFSTTEIANQLQKSTV
jgi:rfaE bifunctional protein nucleotidyltransferase chain/domain